MRPFFLRTAGEAEREGCAAAVVLALIGKSAIRELPLEAGDTGSAGGWRNIGLARRITSAARARLARCVLVELEAAIVRRARLFAALHATRSVRRGPAYAGFAVGARATASAATELSGVAVAARVFVAERTGEQADAAGGVAEGGTRAAAMRISASVPQTIDERRSRIGGSGVARRRGREPGASASNGPHQQEGKERRRGISHALEVAAPAHEVQSHFRIKIDNECA